MALDPAVRDLAAPWVVRPVLRPLDRPDDAAALATRGVTAFAMELMPRITRAQSMDALSSQANLAGYRSVLLASTALGKAFPMMVTAAGTIAPTRVVVLGAGVAGLQAIATARRIGAIVSAMDVRPAVREQVESLGATFLTVGSAEERQAETAGGYAREMSADYRVRQAEKLKEELVRTDVVITTALIPGRPAPVLVTDEMLAAMRPGSVVVDMAASQSRKSIWTNRPRTSTVPSSASVVNSVSGSTRSSSSTAATTPSSNTSWLTGRLPAPGRSATCTSTTRKSASRTRADLTSCQS